MLQPLLLSVALLLPGPNAQSPDWTVPSPLPSPTGSYAVGTYTFRMDDTATFSDGRRVARPLTAQVWYPAKGRKGIAARYADSALIDSMISQKYLDAPAEDVRRWRELSLAASANAAPADASTGAGWPVIAFSHGFGVSRVNYSALVQELASHGYVVISLDHPYGGFALAADRRVLQPGGDSLRRRLGRGSELASVDSALAWDGSAWANEAARAVRHVARSTVDIGHGALRLIIDTAHVGMLGHSLGGAAALLACRHDALFIACADMDGAPVGDVDASGVPKPILVLLSQPGGARHAPKDSAERAHQQAFARMGRDRDSTWLAIRQKNPKTPTYIVKLKGTAHMSFSDAPFLMPTLLQGTGSTLSATEANARINRYLLEFFGHFLRGRPITTLRPGLMSVT
jgi:dienelactone hydrolase